MGDYIWDYGTTIGVTKGDTRSLGKGLGPRHVRTNLASLQEIEGLGFCV